MDELYMKQTWRYFELKKMLAAVLDLSVVLLGKAFHLPLS